MCEHEDDPEVDQLILQFFDDLPSCQAIRVAVALIAGTTSAHVEDAESMEEMIDMSKVVEESVMFLVLQSMLVDGSPNLGFMLLKAITRALMVGNNLVVGHERAALARQMLVMMAKVTAASVDDEEVTRYGRQILANPAFADRLNPESVLHFGLLPTKEDEPSEEAQPEKIAADEAAALKALFDLPSADEPETT